MGIKGKLVSSEITHNFKLINAHDGAPILTSHKGELNIQILVILIDGHW